MTSSRIHSYSEDDPDSKNYEKTSIPSLPSHDVNALKQQVKYLLERQRLLLRDVYEFDAHDLHGLDMRYDIVSLCRGIFGEENDFSPQPILADHLRFPRRDIFGQDVGEYVQEMINLRREMCNLHLLRGPPSSIDPSEILIAEREVIKLPFLFVITSLRL